MSTSFPRVVASTLLLLAFSATAASDMAAEFALLTVEGANNIQNHNLKDMDGRGITYAVRRDYPKMAVDETHFKQLQERGWSECSGTKTQWDSYIDAEGGSWSCVHEFGKYFTRDSSLMVISLKYRSRIKQQAACPPRPLNRTQFVAAVIYEHTDRNAMESAIKRIGVSCKIPR